MVEEKDRPEERPDSSDGNQEEQAFGLPLASAGESASWVEPDDWVEPIQEEPNTVGMSSAHVPPFVSQHDAGAAGTPGKANPPGGKPVAVNPTVPLSLPTAEKGESLWWIAFVLGGFLVFTLLFFVGGGLALYWAYQRLPSDRPRAARSDDVQEVLDRGNTSVAGQDERRGRSNGSPSGGASQANRSGVGLLIDWDRFQDYRVKFNLAATSGSPIYGTVDYTLDKQARVADVLGRLPEDQQKGIALGAGGTGFVVHPSGIVVTCAHVVESMSEVGIRMGQYVWPAKVLSVNSEKDLAILKVDLKVDLKDAHYLSLYESEVTLGMSARVFGFPLTHQLGNRMKMSSGSVSGIDQTAYGNRIQMDATANPGNSGGPVTNDQGQVLGVVDSILAGAAVADVSLAIPVQELKEELERQNVSLGSTDSPLAVSALTEVEKAVVQVVDATSQGMEDWRVVRFRLKVGQDKEIAGTLLANRAGRVIPLTSAPMGGMGMFDLASLGWIPMPGQRTEWSDEQESLVQMEVVTQSRGSSDPFQRHREMVEELHSRMGIPNPRIPSPLSGSRTTSVREITRLVKLEDDFSYTKGRTNFLSIEWNRNASVMTTDRKVEKVHRMTGEVIYDLTNQRLTWGKLFVADKNGNRTSKQVADFTIELLSDVQQAAKQRAAATARTVSARNQRAAELDQKRSTSGVLTKYRWQPKDSAVNQEAETGAVKDEAKREEEGAKNE